MLRSVDHNAAEGAREVTEESAVGEGADADEDGQHLGPPAREFVENKQKEKGRSLIRQIRVKFTSALVRQSREELLGGA